MLKLSQCVKHKDVNLPECSGHANFVVSILRAVIVLVEYDALIMIVDAAHDYINVV